MDPEHLIRDHFSISTQTATATVEAISDQIVQAAARTIQTLDNDGKILICGNGGSASDAQHFAAELVCRYERDRKALGAIALTADTAVLTAAGNDYDFSKIFSRQVQALGRSGDLLVAITTSGQSDNVSLAVETALELDIRVIALTGKDGGKLAPLIAKKGLELRVPSGVTARIQEAHAIIIHCICDLVELHTTGKLLL
ncbi:MAG: SIS domain-containing protein [Pseudomonadota bacterium]|nr:SIS domain-containing protein [Pseudomonadota bacterium]